MIGDLPDEQVAEYEDSRPALQLQEPMRLVRQTCCSPGLIDGVGRRRRVVVTTTQREDTDVKHATWQ